jgi:hypothetical protein
MWMEWKEGRGHWVSRGVDEFPISNDNKWREWTILCMLQCNWDRYENWMPSFMFTLSFTRTLSPTCLNTYPNTHSLSPSLFHILFHHLSIAWCVGLFPVDYTCPNYGSMRELSWWVTLIFFFLSFFYSKPTPQFNWAIFTPHPPSTCMRNSLSNDQMDRIEWEWERGYLMEWEDDFGNFNGVWCRVGLNRFDGYWYWLPEPNNYIVNEYCFIWMRTHACVHVCGLYHEMKVEIAWEEGRRG